MRRFLASRRARARVTAAAGGVLAALAAASGLGVSPAAAAVAVQGPGPTCPAVRRRPATSPPTAAAGARMARHCPGP